MINEIATVDLLDTVIDKIDDGKIADAKDDLITFKDKIQAEIDEFDKWAKVQSEIHDMLELENEMSHNQTVNNDEKKGGI
tara:strand:+ start:12081 stop:12320 length:240 start_codon:yes stop_codon:yes gene_type:complete